MKRGDDMTSSIMRLSTHQMMKENKPRKQAPTMFTCRFVELKLVQTADISVWIGK